MQDGTQVRPGAPRFEPGKFGQAVMVEEGCTNIVATWPTGWNVSNPTTNANLVATNMGVQPGAAGNTVRLTNSGTHEGFYASPKFALNPSTTYTLRLKVRGTVGTGKFDVFVLSATGPFVQLDGNSFPGSSWTPTSAWQTIYATFTTTANITGTEQYIRFDHDGNDAGYIEIAEVTLIKKAYPLSFPGYGTTRSPETLTIPTAGVLNPQEGTVECWVYVDSLIKNTAANRYIFAHTTSSGSPYPNRLSLAHEIDNKWVLFSSNGAGQNSSVAVLDTLSMGWHHFSVRWSSSELALFIDGVKVGYVTNPYLPETLADSIYIGCWAGGTYGWSNTLIDELRISSRARTDEEIAAAYASNQPLPVDEWTTCKMSFDGNLYGIVPAFGYDTTCRSSKQEEYAVSAVGTNGIESSKSTIAYSTCVLDSYWLTNETTKETVKLKANPKWGRMYSERNRTEEVPVDSKYPTVLYSPVRFYRGSFQATLLKPTNMTWSEYIAQIRRVLDADSPTPIIFRSPFGDLLKVYVYDLEIHPTDRLDKTREISFGMVEAEEAVLTGGFSYDNPPTPLDTYWVIDTTTGKGFRLYAEPNWDGIRVERDSQEIIGLSSKMPILNYGAKKATRSGFTGLILKPSVSNLTLADEVMRLRELIDGKEKKPVLFRTPAGESFLVDVYGFSYELFNRIGQARRVSFEFVEVGGA